MKNKVQIPPLAKDTSALILAAGRGERMRPLTDTLPKPMLSINGKSLLQYHLEKLAKQGFQDIVINVDHLADKIIDAIGDGKQYGLSIQYSDERMTGALETAGGIIKALPLLKSHRFIVINGDIWTNFDYIDLLAPSNKANQIVLVENPAHNKNGDFSITYHKDKSLSTIAPASQQKTYTYSGIGIYEKALFEALPLGKYKLAPLLHRAIAAEQLGALLCEQEWFDIGTAERLDEINAHVQNSSS